MKRLAQVSPALLTLLVLVASVPARGQSSSRVNVPHPPSPAAPGGVPGGGGTCDRALAVCYYDLCDGIDDLEGGGGEGCIGQGDVDQEPPILLAGHTPVWIDVPDAATLAGCEILFAQNESNDGFNTEWADNLPAIAAAVQGGMVLVFHDRAVGVEEEGGDPELPGNAADFVPGLSGAVCVRDFSDDEAIDVVTGGTAVTDGPFGVIDDSSLDGGSSSSHGYCTQASLPTGATSFLSRTISTESVAFAYFHGAGTVYYSTMPLDYYLDGSGDDPPRETYNTVYAPNVLTYAAEASPACRLPTLVDIPTLSPAGLGALAALLGAGSLWALRRRARRAT